MAKKKEFASDSDVSRFITQKQGVQSAVEVQEVQGAQETQSAADNDKPSKGRVQLTIYPYKAELEKMKIIAKVKDRTLSTMVLDLIKESMEKDEYRRIVRAYEQMMGNLEY